ncbi:MAG: type 1 glutamine amidotransferase [Oceanospirillaceae bacterium]
MKTITIGILETGLPPEEYRQQHGSYPDMFSQLLANSDKHLKFQYFHVLDDDIPTAPTQCDAWLITGSKFGVYEDHSWIPKLETLIQQAFAQDIPVVGICFGHQLVAQALGGKVIKSDKGWSLGVNEYQIDATPSWMNSSSDSAQTTNPSSFSIQAYHQDQVVQLPADTQVLASSDFCPFAALNFNNRAISFQGHPEFAADYTKKLLTNRRDLKLLPYELSSKAIDEIENPIQRQLVADWICNFLRFKLSDNNA